MEHPLTCPVRLLLLQISHNQPFPPLFTPSLKEKSFSANLCDASDIVVRALSKVSDPVLIQNSLLPLLQCLLGEVIPNLCLDFLFLIDSIVKSSFRFTIVLGRRYREAAYVLSSTHVGTPYPLLTSPMRVYICFSDEPTSTHHCHPKSIP